ncbi:toprim domain-containing protein [Maribellus maritimus]|uniref:toprim domain-containing protein n=1 Tax=Maribellus maritimus TaxID=2870838 RepID=UPI001EEBB42E|nr:toprim domain-containing protein [Maribellus maritimus]MCG6188026.1 toprim domain-containing protein [Maribellus maritimus]
MKKEKLQCDTAREITIVDFLKENAVLPQRENHKEAWFLSPLREEKEASFKVSKLLNRWYDHGLGQGGNIIDLVIAMNNHCSVREALSILDKIALSFSFQKQEIFAIPEKQDEIKIESVRNLQHPALITRRINPSVATCYAKEVHYSFRGRTYFAIGLENISGGWELRNLYFKNAASPKDFSYFNTGKQMLSVTEGMFDFFSLLMFYPRLPHKSDFLILNSVSFTNRTQKVVLPYSKIGLYLDNDPAGRKATKQLMADLSNSVDMSALYDEKKDLNQLLTASIQRCRRPVR